MIITENLGTVERRYSDQNVKLRQVETNTLWNDAVNTIPCQFTYEETEIPIDPVELEPEIPENLTETAEYLLQTESMELPEPEEEPDYFNESEKEPNYFG